VVRGSAFLGQRRAALHTISAGDCVQNRPHFAV